MRIERLEGHFGQEEESMQKPCGGREHRAFEELKAKHLVSHGVSGK